MYFIFALNGFRPFDLFARYVDLRPWLVAEVISGESAILIALFLDINIRGICNLKNMIKYNGNFPRFHFFTGTVQMLMHSI